MYVCNTKHCSSEIGKNRVSSRACFIIVHKNTVKLDTFFFFLFDIGGSSSIYFHLGFVSCEKQLYRLFRAALTVASWHLGLHRNAIQSNTMAFILGLSMSIALLDPYCCSLMWFVWQPQLIIWLMDRRIDREPITCHHEEMMSSQLWPGRSTDPPFQKKISIGCTQFQLFKVQTTSKMCWKNKKDTNAIVSFLEKLEKRITRAGWV